MSEKNKTKAAASPSETLDNVADAMHDRSRLSSDAGKSAEAYTNPSGTDTTNAKK